MWMKRCLQMGQLFSVSAQCTMQVKQNLRVCACAQPGWMLAWPPLPLVPVRAAVDLANLQDIFIADAAGHRHLALTAAVLLPLLEPDVQLACQPGIHEVLGCCSLCELGV
jgi:hypothetical protein